MTDRIVEEMIEHMQEPIDCRDLMASAYIIDLWGGTPASNARVRWRITGLREGKTLSERSTRRSPRRTR